MAEKTRARDACVTLTLCFLAALAEGFDVQSMGVAAPKLSAALHVTREQLGPVFSASIFGLFVGAMLLGRVADIVGRRWTLIASLIVFGVFSIATAYAYDLQTLLIVRVLTGLGLGGAMPNLIALTAESASPARKSSVVTAMASGMPFGGAIASAIAATVDWRSIFFVGGAAPLLIALVMIPLLPESRAFLSGKADIVRREREGALSALFGGGRATATLLLWSAFFFTLLVLYLLLNWLPSLMTARGLTVQSASIVSLLFNIGGGIGALALSLLINLRQRGLVVLASYLGMAASLFALALVGPDLVWAGTVGFVVGVFVVGAQLMLYGIAPDFYDAAICGTGVGAAVAMGRLGAVAGPLLAAVLLAAGGDAQRVLFAILPAVAIGGASALLLLWRRATPRP